MSDVRQTVSVSDELEFDIVFGDSAWKHGYDFVIIFRYKKIQACRQEA